MTPAAAGGGWLVRFTLRLTLSFPTLATTRKDFPTSQPKHAKVREAPLRSRRVSLTKDKEQGIERRGRLRKALGPFDFKPCFLTQPDFTSYNTMRREGHAVFGIRHAQLPVVDDAANGTLTRGSQSKTNAEYACENRKYGFQSS